jgi:hypothetical protein
MKTHISHILTSPTTNMQGTKQGNQIQVPQVVTQDFGQVSATAIRTPSQNDFRKTLTCRIMYQNETSVLLQSGQPKIIDAWLNCISTQRGGPVVYFTEVPGLPNRVDLRIENLASRNNFVPDVKVARDVFINRDLGEPESRQTTKNVYKRIMRSQWAINASFDSS